MEHESPAFIYGQSMEKLINSIPKEINLSGFDKVTGTRQGNGFSLRYSSSREKWLCGYSINFRVEKDDKYQPWEEADDALEALALFVEKLSTKNKEK